ncbi:MAG: hypothetical protein WCT03_24210 [Candidatus Obscuribacterales bacterium]|jgi:hypothetical protein
MARRDSVIARLAQTVDLLGALADSFVFVGGSVAPLLVTDTGAADARSTIDVDAVVQVATRSEYQEIETRLAAAKFQLDPTEDVVCRYKNGELLLDVIPSASEVFGFGNKWLNQAPDAPLLYELATRKTINIINAPLFLCTKFIAFDERGPAEDKDLEDIVSIVDGRRELMGELKTSSLEIKEYVASSTRQLLKTSFPQNISWFLPQDSASADRDTLVLERFKMMQSLT